MKLLLIAGMGESVGLARELSAIEGHEVICVTEGRAVARAEPPAKIFEGTFRSDAEFRRYIAQEQFDLIVDAAHPFQFQLGAWAQDTGLSYLRVMRQPWTPKSGERWINVGSLTEGIANIPHGATVFLATGRGSISAFAKRPDIQILCRQLEVHDRPFPHPNGRFVFGEGPFSISTERDLFQRLEVDALMLRNSGSGQGRSKVDAACVLGLKVIMIERPDMGLDADQMAEIDSVVHWVRTHADH